MLQDHEPIGLRFVGDPFIDNGVATLIAATGIHDPANITPADVEPFIQELIEVYIAPFMSNYLTGVVFTNADFANPAQNGNPKYDKPRREKLEAWLRLFQRGQDGLGAKMDAAGEGEVCIYSAEPAVVRVSKMIIPMMGSEDAINFVPEGRPKLPVAGWVVLAFLAMPMGTINSGGRILMPHTADYDLLVALAKQNLDRNRQAFQLVQENDWLKKRPNYKFPKTQLISALVDIESKRGSYPITAYHFTSSSQSADVRIFYLSAKVLELIVVARHKHAASWQAIVQRAWNMGEEEKADEKKGTFELYTRNYFYEELFDLPQNATAFLRRYLLRFPRLGKKDKDDPRFGYSSTNERNLIDWNLIQTFMEIMMNIEKQRIEAIKTLGDRLADYIQNVDERLYNKLFMSRNPQQFRQELMRAANRAKTQNVGSLVPLEEFVQVFFVDEGDFYRDDAFLAQDLLLIRVIEKLSPDFVAQNVELLQQAEASLAEAEAES